MTEPFSEETVQLFRDAGFTPDELTAIINGLEFARALIASGAGPVVDVGDIGAGLVKWTPMKREIVHRLVADIRPVVEAEREEGDEA